ncbi:MAG: carboxynorspermidine decarboxylase [Lachnospiraceae bacterium]|nr:carboxynorspermidine decarboxylase [Lachnospiraceae bacterium]
MKLHEILTPAYVVDEGKLIKNLEILKGVQEHTGCKILLAQKAFSMFCEYPLIGQYLSGTTASGLYEARLGHEEMGKENHIISPAYRESEIDEIAELCDHVIFNSFSQLRRFGDRCRGKASIGLRINPECSTQGASVSPEAAASGLREADAIGTAANGADVNGAAANEADAIGAAANEADANGADAHQVHPSIYDPCAPGSRLGITQENFERELSRLWGQGVGWQTSVCDESEDRRAKARIYTERETKFEWNRGPQHGLVLPDCVEGLHFHTLCEQNADDLETTLKAVERRFGPYLKQVKWLNMGGGHHITRPDYDIERLERCIRHMQETYDLQIYLEPGEAVALNAGYLVTEVMDLVENGGVTTLILDASAACHMPDVLEMPYRPPLHGSGLPGEKPYTYRLSSCTCLAGDIIGDYSFDREIHPGDRLYFEDMAIYSMVKNNTFNGIALPSIWVMEAKIADLKSGNVTEVKNAVPKSGNVIEAKISVPDLENVMETKRNDSGSGNVTDESESGKTAETGPQGECRLIKEFGYEDFKGRLS